MATDSSTYGERERERGGSQSRVGGVGLEGGAGGGVEGAGLRTSAFCLSDVSLCFICQSSTRVWV